MNVHWVYGSNEKYNSFAPINQLAAFFNFIKVIPAKLPDMTKAGYNTN
jgi:hypothetical protein